jgi:hypothetical protein
MSILYKKLCSINHFGSLRHLSDLRDRGVSLSGDLFESIADLQSLHLLEDDAASVATAIRDMRRALGWTDEVVELLNEAERKGCVP